MIRVVSIFFLSLFVVSNAFSQDIGDRYSMPTITLQEVIKVALANSPQVEAAQKSVENSEQQVDIAKAGRRPSVDASIDYTFEDDPVKMADPGQWSFFGAGVSISQPLYEGGVISNSIKSARMSLEKAAHSFSDKKQMFVLQVANIYATVLQDYLSYDVAKAHCGLMSDLIERIGEDHPDANAAELKQMVMSDLKHEIIARQEIATLTFEKLVQDLSPATHFLEEISEVSIPETDDEAYLRATTGNPKLLACDASIEVARRDISIAKGEYRPTVTLKGGYADLERDSSEYGNFSRRGSWLGLGVKVPLYSGGTRGKKLTQAKNNLRIARLEKEELELEIKEQVKVLYVRIKRTQSRLQKFVRAIELAEKVVQQKWDELLQAPNSVDFYLSAQDELYNARQGFIKEQYAYFMYAFALHTVMGTLNEAVGVEL